MLRGSVWSTVCCRLQSHSDLYFILGFLGDACAGKHPEEPLHLHITQVLLKEPWEDGKSTGGAGSSQEKTGMYLNVPALGKAEP